MSLHLTAVCWHLMSDGTTLYDVRCSCGYSTEHMDRDSAHDLADMHADLAEL